MNIAAFSTRPYDRRFLDEATDARTGPDNVELNYFAEALSLRSVSLAQCCEAVCVFVNDVLDTPVPEALA